jgi:hypothetical protein
MELTGLTGYEGKDKNKKQIHKKTEPFLTPSRGIRKRHWRIETTHRKANESLSDVFVCPGGQKRGRERTETEEIGGVF